MAVVTTSVGVTSVRNYLEFGTIINIGFTIILGRFLLKNGDSLIWTFYSLQTCSNKFKSHIEYKTFDQTYFELAKFIFYSQYLARFIVCFRQLKLHWESDSIWSSGRFQVLCSDILWPKTGALKISVLAFQSIMP